MSERAPPPPPVAPLRSRRRSLAVGAFLFVALPIALIVTFGAALVLFGPWVAFPIPSGSMMPTILPGDYVVVDKWRFRAESPRRGDIIVFRARGFSGGDESGFFIARIVGMPGDRIQMVKGVPVVNGQPLSQQRQGEFTGPGAAVLAGRRIRERLPDGRAYTIMKYTTMGMLDEGPEYDVPPGAYFVLGDNRDDAIDSRSRRSVEEQKGWTVSRASIIGPATFIVWSGSERLGRVGMTLE